MIMHHIGHSIDVVDRHCACSQEGFQSTFSSFHRHFSQVVDAHVSVTKQCNLVLAVMLSCVTWSCVKKTEWHTHVHSQDLAEAK